MKRCIACCVVLLLLSLVLLIRGEVGTGILLLLVAAALGFVAWMLHKDKMNGHASVFVKDPQRDRAA